MRLNRFILDFQIKGDDMEFRDVEITNQLRNVLRLKEGDSIVICDGKGLEVESQITGFGKESFSVKLINIQEKKPVISSKVILFCAVLKKENFELIVQKATEIGVSEIVPLITERTVKLGLNVERLKKIAREASEQSGRSFLPVINDPLDFSIAVQNYKDKLNLFFDHCGTAVKKEELNKDSIGLWIGPEGGWDVGELAQATEAGFRIASLGPLTLRAETAAVAASFFVCNNLYDINMPSEGSGIINIS